MYTHDTFLVHTSEILGDTYKGLTGNEINKYFSEYAVKSDVSLPIKGQHPNKHTRILEYLKQFPKDVFANICNQLTLILLEKDKDNNKVKEFRQKLFENYGSYIKEKISDEEFIQDTRHWLQDYPKAYEIYNRAIIQFESQNFNRHILDDMRLSLELLLKDILNNNKSLENQKDELGKKLENNNISVYIRNMFIPILNMYCKYNNDNVKHNEKITVIETKYLIEQTSIFMKFIISVLGSKKV